MCPPRSHFVHVSRLSKRDRNKRSIFLVLKATGSSLHLLMGKCKQTQAATLRGRCESGVPQGQEKLSQVSSLTSATRKLSQGMSLTISFINRSNAARCKCSKRLVVCLLYLEPEPVLVGRVPLMSYGSPLGLAQGRSVKGENDVF